MTFTSRCTLWRVLSGGTTIVLLLLWPQAAVSTDSFRMCWGLLQTSWVTRCSERQWTMSSNHRSHTQVKASCQPSATVVCLMHGYVITIITIIIIISFIFTNDRQTATSTNKEVQLKIRNQLTQSYIGIKFFYASLALFPNLHVTGSMSQAELFGLDRSVVAVCCL